MKTEDFTPGCTAAESSVKITSFMLINEKWTAKAFYKAVERGDEKAIKRMINKGRIKIYQND